MLEDKRAGLFTMTGRAHLVVPRHGQSAGWLEDVATVGVVAVHTVHVTLNDRMMLRQLEFGLNIQMTTETRLGLFARIDDEPGRAAGFNMPAAGTVTCFASGKL